MVRFGLLGAGRIGQIHGRNIAASKRAVLVAIADPMPGAAESLAEATGASVRTLDEILAAGDIDAVLIATPTDTHADFIDRAAKAGKAVLCEKPVDLSSARIEETLKAVEKAGVPLMIGFNRRFDPNFAALQARVAEGAVGTVELITILSRDPAPPPVSYIKHSGGLFRDMMIHDFDMARFLLGEEVVEVHSVGSSLVDPAIGEAGDVDTAAVLLKTASGKICQISNSRRATYGYDQRIEVHGSEGMISAGNVHETTVRLAGKNGVTADPVQNFFLERYAAAYAREIEAFIDAIAEGRQPRPNGRDGLEAQRLADAATTAHQTGKSVKLG
ncbi:inositol 2-dehydrogenase [Phyllobacterium salinisoli]|uniref:Inositol 2-dehydrogenase n=1 Tax=Phyllobacterium salinisoli TaxID=1899321 RepID=A0A368K2X7_9HYPH|nr:inositol 2-dehydrogenase [Phyllobacterium salinisoli]RCS23737.1 inositol 2-dehydrogenase [Phyllobacterium salinisoli]